MSSLEKLSNLEVDKLQILFQQVAQLVRDTSAGSVTTSSDEKLQLYGLYKQVQEGPCPEESVPPLYRSVARSKYQAWREQRHLSRSKAAFQYISLIASRGDSLGEGCRDLVEKFLSRSYGDVVNHKGSSVMEHIDPSTSHELSPQRSTKSESDFEPDLDFTKGSTEAHSFLRYLYFLLSKWCILICRCFGVRPMIPRGRLDISYRDIMFAIWQSCLWWKETPHHCHLLHCKIRNLWADKGVAVGLSARSLFDLYLAVRNFKAGSEVIVVPPINVPGMMRVLGFHDVKIVPIDLPEDCTEWIDVKTIRNAITKDTVAIMIVHPFGMISVSNEQFEELRQIADGANIELWEDCAECFVGLNEKNSFLGYSKSDVRLFSFGLIKTTTALAGGVAIFRDCVVRQDVERLQDSWQQVHSPLSYLGRSMLALALNFIADSPWRVGLLGKLCDIFGFDFDSFVTKSLRGFNVQDGIDRRAIEESLVRQIRRRPSRALLSVMLRRFEHSKLGTPESVSNRRLQSIKLRNLLETSMEESLIQNGMDRKNTFWTFPIRCRNRHLISSALAFHGYDVVSGASQLCCVSKFSTICCPNAENMMQSILYVPIATQRFKTEDIERMANTLNLCVGDATMSSKNVDTGLTGTDVPPIASLSFIVATSLLLLQGMQIPMSYIFRISFFLVAKVWLAFLVGFTTVLFSSCFLQWSAARLYLNGSRAFAENCDMVDAATNEAPVSELYNTSGNSIIADMAILDIPEKTALEIKRSVVLTGATGFVGSILLRDLLLKRGPLNIHRIYVVARSKNKTSAASRIQVLLEKPMFSFVTNEEKKQLVDVLDGDVSLPHAGLSPDIIKQITLDPSVTHFFHCAASVGFTQEFPAAAKANISSALNMQSIAKDCTRHDLKFIHLSTAFVHGGCCGSANSPLPEELFPLGPFNPTEIYRSMLGTQFYASKAMTELKFPNSYTLSKCVCEHLLLQQKKVDTIIVRPSIVGPAVEFPFEGWAGEKPSTIVGGACLHLLNQWNIWYLEPNSVSHIPVDVLSRFIIARAMDGAADDALASEVSSTSDESFDRLSRVSVDMVSMSDSSCSTLPKVSQPDASHQKIFNATWDSSVQPETFSWLEFSITYLQLGCVLGYFDRGLALVTLIVSAQLVPRTCSSENVYRWAHNTFIRGPIVTSLRILEKLSLPRKSVQKLISFLDLPLLFFPFVRRTYYFHSALVLPQTFNAKRYVFSIAVAAHRFISRKSKRHREKDTSMLLGRYLIGGKGYLGRISDFRMILSQPKGSIPVRFCAYLFSKILRRVCSDVTVDLPSFCDAIASLKTFHDDNVILVLAPTHRSFFDFILLSYVMFMVPELQIDIPYIIAADEFKYLPILGWLAETLRAIFVKRGLGQQDPQLNEQILQLKRNTLRAVGSSIEVFLEGKRSRDRRFVNPKTGFLKCLNQSGGNHVIVPIAISYERLPEQHKLCHEGSSYSHRPGMNLRSLFGWLADVFRGRIELGNVHIAANLPVTMPSSFQDDFSKLAADIQNYQKQKIVLSQFHFSSSAKLLGLSEELVARGLIKLGAKAWPQGASQISIPTDSSELASILLHAGHLLAPLFAAESPDWASWLDPSHICSDCDDHPCAIDSDVLSIRSALKCKFDLATAAVAEASKSLKAHGYERPNSAHLLQIAILSNSSQVPTIFIHAAIHLAQSIENNAVTIGEEEDFSPIQVQSPEMRDSPERLGFWGFSDSAFVARSNNNTKNSVAMIGKRYKLCNRSLSKILPFMEAEMHIRIDLLREFPSISPKWNADIRSELNGADLKYLDENFELSISIAERVRHGTGHSQEDIYAIRNGSLERVPDAVVWLTTEEHALKLTRAAKERKWCLIPFGGGTNVTNATRCPSRRVEPRPIISVDMKKMNHIISLNEEDGVAHVETGITGRDLVRELKRRGYTMGHEPDSFEFSTLGGWIATKASGMKRSRYGNIENIVLSTRVITATGVMWKEAAGRVAEGMDVCSLVMGSEGSLGIITSAFIRIWPLPQELKYDSIVFPTFDDGLCFVRELSRKGPGSLPASVRLLDNNHFRLGQALRPDACTLFEKASEAFRGLVSSAMFGSWDSSKVVCATVTYEGTRGEVIAQEASVKELYSQHGGTRLGSSIGKAGYELTFMIAYLRDFAMTYHVLGESFETFVPWSKIDRLIPATKRRIEDEHCKRLLPGKPFVGCRVTQLYHEGACLYFYLCIAFDGVNNPSQVYSELESAARDEILKHGGSLSHHHGIGKHRAIHLKDRMSPAFSQALMDIKKAVDDENVFGAQNGPFDLTSS